MKQCKPFVEEGVHPRVIIKSFRRATQLALEKIKELSVSVGKENKEELRELLVKCAATAMSSKLIHQQKDFFSNMVRETKFTLNLIILSFDILEGPLPEVVDPSLDFYLNIYIFLGG